jgi:hypothetical protein
LAAFFFATSIVRTAFVLAAFGRGLLLLPQV